MNVLGSAEPSFSSLSRGYSFSRFSRRSRLSRCSRASRKSRKPVKFKPLADAKKKQLSILSGVAFFCYVYVSFVSLTNMFVLMAYFPLLKWL